ncbi:Abi family protein [Yersinia enterocolitica]|uniref:Abi family protein n=1 Tax=Yersinia enterocolitica TaxID=630 RepID=UPI00067AF8F4|nr:Abi family protein [Yersinia enterocolitica]MBW5835509.1 Abi family protein [Yersinia enterocolitica]
MYKKINYPQIKPFISEAKINSIKAVFGSGLNDMECYGIYIWSQKASSAIYPILQHLEITLRNSVDKEAKKAFGGDFWWDKIFTDKTKDKFNDFNYNIEKAKRRCSLISHDNIIANTDFFTWQAVFSEAFHSKRKNINNALWPKISYKILKSLDRSMDEQTARLNFVNKLNEIRLYRNRLSHNDCIWIKIKSNNQKSAIDSILEKINDAELLIKIINPNVHNALAIWGVFDHGRRVCSVHEMDLYLGKGFKNLPASGKLKLLNSIYDETKSGKKSNVLSINGDNLSIHRF